MVEFEFSLVQNGRQILLKIIKQDERIERGCHLVYRSLDDRFAVFSINVPEIRDDYIYIRGVDKEGDDDVMIVSYDSETTAKKRYEFYRDALLKFAKECVI